MVDESISSTEHISLDKNEDFEYSENDNLKFDLNFAYDVINKLNEEVCFFKKL
jgi:hypothetical protein